LKKRIRSLSAVGLIAVAAVGLTSIHGSATKTVSSSAKDYSIVKIAQAMQSRAFVDQRSNALGESVVGKRTHMIAVDNDPTNSRLLENAQAEYPVSRTVQVLATGYSSGAGACTATMTQPRWGEIAVDPNFIPLGSYVEIPQFPGTIFHAEDTGGAIKGWRIDIWFPTTGDALQWGVKSITIQVLQSAPSGVPGSIPCTTP
jgi:3D (Asp-Asp-Asp) domain-containing protein